MYLMISTFRRRFKSAWSLMLIIWWELDWAWMDDQTILLLRLSLRILNFLEMYCWNFIWWYLDKIVMKRCMFHIWRSICSREILIDWMMLLLSYYTSTSVSEHNLTIIYCIISCVWGSYFACRCRLIDTYFMASIRSNLFIMAILLFQILDLLQDLTWILYSSNLH